MPTAAPPSIWFFNRVYPPTRGATGRLLCDLAETMVRDGWQVTVFTAGPEKADMVENGVRIIRVKDIRSKSSLSYIRVWMELLLAGLRQRGAPDVIATMTDPPMLVLAGQFMARMKKARHIHWVQDLYPDLLPHVDVHLPLLLTRRLQAWVRSAMNAADRVIVIGRCMGRYLVHTGVTSKNMLLIQNWPDKELVQSFDDYNRTHTEEQRMEMRSSSGKPLIVDQSPKFRVLYAGTLGRAHPMATILDAAAILQVQIPDVEFLFVSHPSGQAELAAERQRRGLHNIRMLPLQPNYRLPDLMLGGDVHLISMKDEVLGMMVPSKLYAAVAAERPSILLGPEQSETGKILQEYQAGMVVRQGDVDGLVQAIRSYRYDEGVWFSAHEGARKASRMIVRDELIELWIKKAREILGYPPR